MASHLKIIAAAAIIAVGAVPSLAQQICGPEQSMLEMLYSRYKEFPVWSGDVDQGRRVIMTQSEEGAWTILTVINGQACLMVAGQNARFDKGI